MAKAKFSNQKSIEELQSLLEDLDGGDIGIDQLAGKVKRGKELLQLCQDKLRATEEDIATLIE